MCIGSTLHAFCKEMEKCSCCSRHQEWNILDAMCNVAVSWKSIVPVVILFCSAKGGFATVNEVSPGKDEGNEWMEFQGHMDCPCIFDEFLIVGKLIQNTSSDVPSCKCGNVGGS
jgi:hypothetical protein